MTPEHTSQPKAFAWIMTAAVVVILLLGFSIRSLVMLFVAPQQAGAVRPESAMAEAMPTTVSAQNEEQGVPNHEHAAGPMAAPNPVSAAPVQAPKKTSEFAVDYQTLREREAARKEMMNNLREIAKENPESGYAMTEEQLRKFEQSGASFQ